MPDIYPYAKTQRCALLKSLFVFAALLSTNFLFAQPVITSFSPVSGPVGSTVTIAGSNFSTTATDNIVFFGAVKAPVTAATSTSLTVTVPTGSTYQPITVTTNGLTGYAQQPFNVTFPLGGLLSNASFPDRSDMTTSNFPGDVYLSDMDDDGKPDLIVLNGISLGFSVYKNNSTAGNISFLPKTDIYIGHNAANAALGDIDGDGKTDLVITTRSVTNSDNPLIVYKNTSTPGAISFEQTVVATMIYSTSVHLNDIDGDGKSDLLVAHMSSNSIWVYKNTGTVGAIAFASKVSFPTGGIAPRTVVVSDMDKDGKPDIIATNNTSEDFSVLRNISNNGTISFAGNVIGSTLGTPMDLKVGDLDNDGKNDVVITNSWTTNVSIYRNTSSAGTVSFAPMTTITSGDNPWSISMNDLDGDGKPDLAVTNYNADIVSQFINTSTPGAISFKPKMDLQTGDTPDGIITGDLDGDTRPDMAVVNIYGNTLSIYRNKSEPVITYFSPTSGSAGTVITITGKNLGGATSVSIGGIPVTSFTIISSTTITAVVTSSSKGAVSVTTPIGTASLDGFGLTPTITSFSPAAGPIGTTVTISGTNFSVTASDNTVYFGSLKATVLSASATTLTVTVPGCTNYDPISVTANKLTAWSAAPFTITFPTIGANFTANSLGAGVDYISGSSPFDACTGDVDGDGKNDIVTANSQAKTVSVFRNTSVNGSISFATQVDYTSDYPYILALTDIDGDGKQDIISGNSGSVSVFKNNCTPGTISFTHLTDIALPNGLSDIVVTDLDNDGKPDLAVSDASGLVIIKNTSTGGTVSFGPPVYFATGYMPNSLAVGDLDGDGKPDFVVTSTDNPVAHNGKISVFRNLMTSGAPFSTSSLAAKVNYLTAKETFGVKIADLDGDGKPDIVTNNSESGTLSIFKNTSTSGTISLATQINYNTGTSTTLLSVDDIDGDGKPDLILPINYYKVGLMKNTSTAGTISFASIVKYDNANEPRNSSTGDLDGDGKPEIIIANYSGDGFTIYRNQIAEPTVTPSGNSPVIGNIVNKLVIDGSVQSHNGTPYVQRHYDILPDNNAASATATITLYFTQQEFDNFNATANHGADLPTGSADATGKANLRIYQYHGTSTTRLPGSYTGSAVAIDPDDANIVWNATTQWWEVTFEINGFSGFFASNTTFNYLQPTAPVITATGNTTFCNGGSVTLNSSAAAGNIWYKNGTVINGATSTTLVVTAGGTYTATSTTSGVASPQSAGIVVTATPVPAKPTITRNGSQLVSSASSGNQWYKDGAAIGGANNATLTPTETGNYSVQVTVDGCSSAASDNFNHTVTGVIDLDNNQFIKLSPNPVQDKVILDFNVAGSSSLTIQIIDIHGKICKTFTNQSSGTPLSFAGLNNGVYIANIFTSNQKQRYSIRLIKQ